MDHHQPANRYQVLHNEDDPPEPSAAEQPPAPPETPQPPQPAASSEADVSPPPYCSIAVEAAAPSETHNEFYPVPPPYSVATSLPTYDEAEKAKAAAMAAAAAEVAQRHAQFRESRSLFDEIFLSRPEELGKRLGVKYPPNTHPVTAEPIFDVLVGQIERRNSHIIIFHQLPQLFSLVVFFLVALTPIAGTSPTWGFPHFDLMHQTESKSGYFYCVRSKLDKAEYAALIHALAFIFNWIGFCLSFCITNTIAGRYGAICGFGLSLIKWILIVRFSDYFTGYFNGQYWLWWIFLVLGLLLFFRGFVNYLKVRNMSESMAAAHRTRFFFLY